MGKEINELRLDIGDLNNNINKRLDELNRKLNSIEDVLDHIFSLIGARASGVRF